jgi:hypothetical protein
MAKRPITKGPDAGQNLRHVLVGVSDDEIEGIERFMVNVAMPGTPRTVAMRFLLVTGLEYLEDQKSRAVTAS